MYRASQESAAFESTVYSVLQVVFEHHRRLSTLKQRSAGKTGHVTNELLLRDSVRTSRTRHFACIVLKGNRSLVGAFTRRACCA
jgi:hypothetical protein